MRVCVFASSSSGNCLLISDQNTNILIDAGISMRRVQNALAQAGLTAEDIGGVLITHEHSDHVKGLSALSKKFSLPIYAPRTVACRLAGAYPELEGQIRIIPVGERTVVGSLAVTAFHTMHDTDESVGYRVEGSSVFAIATDTGCVTEEISSKLLGADTVLVEANHDVRMLRDGAYPFVLKKRILSDRGHLSNDDCALLARALADSGTRQLILGHLSRENNTPELAMQTVGDALNGTGARLLCAPVLGFLELEVGSREPCFA